jgi:hypothetical protein
MLVPISFKRGNTHSKQSKGICFTNPKKGQSGRLPWVKTDQGARNQELNHFNAGAWRYELWAHDHICDQGPGIKG